MLGAKYDDSIASEPSEAHPGPSRSQKSVQHLSTLHSNAYGGRHRGYRF